MFKLPEIRKAINKFLTSEDGKISKKAVIGIGALIALAASASKVKAGCNLGGVWGTAYYNTAMPPEGYSLITNICISATRHLNDTDSQCDQGILAYCNEISHKNSIQIIPKTGEILATHSHSVKTVEVSAWAGWYY